MYAWLIDQCLTMLMEYSYQSLTILCVTSRMRLLTNNAQKVYPVYYSEGLLVAMFLITFLITYG